MPGLASLKKKREHIEQNWLINQLDGVLSTDNSNRQKAAGSFWPSSLGNPCDRFLYLHYHGLLPPMKISAQLRRIFDHGNATQKRYREYFIRMGVYVTEDRPFKIENPPISGKADFELRFANYSRFIVELKTINDAEFKKLQVPKPDHEIQLQVYLNALSAQDGCVMYENKNNQALKVFAVKKDPNIYDDIINRCRRIMTLMSIPKIVEPHNFKCECLNVR